MSYCISKVYFYLSPDKEAKVNGISQRNLSKHHPTIAALIDHIKHELSKDIRFSLKDKRSTNKGKKIGDIFFEPINPIKHERIQCSRSTDSPREIHKQLEKVEETLEENKWSEYRDSILRNDTKALGAIFRALYAVPENLNLEVLIDKVKSIHYSTFNQSILSIVSEQAKKTLAENTIKEHFESIKEFFNLRIETFEQSEERKVLFNSIEFINEFGLQYILITLTHPEQHIFKIKQFIKNLCYKIHRSKSERIAPLFQSTKRKRTPSSDYGKKIFFNSGYELSISHNDYMLSNNDYESEDSIDEVI